MTKTKSNKPTNATYQPTREQVLRCPERGYWQAFLHEVIIQGRHAFSSGWIAPKPLTEEEEAKLLERIDELEQEGDAGSIMYAEGLKLLREFMESVPHPLTPMGLAGLNEPDAFEKFATYAVLEDIEDMWAKKEDTRYDPQFLINSYLLIKCAELGVRAYEKVRKEALINVTAIPYEPHSQLEWIKYPPLPRLSDDADEALRFARRLVERFRRGEKINFVISDQSDFARRVYDYLVLLGLPMKDVNYKKGTEYDWLRRFEKHGYEIIELKKEEA